MISRVDECAKSGCYGNAEPGSSYCRDCQPLSLRRNLELLLHAQRRRLSDVKKNLSWCNDRNDLGENVNAELHAELGCECELERIVKELSDLLRAEPTRAYEPEDEGERELKAIERRAFYAPYLVEAKKAEHG